MSEEFSTLLQIGMCELILRSQAQNIIGCKWGFQVKWKLNGSVDHYKAQIVAKIFHQWRGVEFIKLILLWLMLGIRS